MGDYASALIDESTEKAQARSAASTRLNEMGFHADWIEQQLAYNCADHLGGRVDVTPLWTSGTGGLDVGTLHLCPAISDKCRILKIGACRKYNPFFWWAYSRLCFFTPIVSLRERRERRDFQFWFGLL